MLIAGSTFRMSGSSKVFLALGTDVEQSDHGDFGGRVEANVVTKANQHNVSAARGTVVMRCYELANVRCRN